MWYCIIFIRWRRLHSTLTSSHLILYSGINGKICKLPAIQFISWLKGWVKIAVWNHVYSARQLSNAYNNHMNQSIMHTSHYSNGTQIHIIVNVYYTQSSYTYAYSPSSLLSPYCTHTIILCKSSGAGLTCEIILYELYILEMLQNNNSHKLHQL